MYQNSTSKLYPSASRICNCYLIEHLKPTACPVVTEAYYGPEEFVLECGNLITVGTFNFLMLLY